MVGHDRKRIMSRPRQPATNVKRAGFPAGAHPLPPALAAWRTVLPAGTSAATMRRGLSGSVAGTLLSLAMRAAGCIARGTGPLALPAKPVVPVRLPLSLTGRTMAAGALAMPIAVGL